MSIFDNFGTLAGYVGGFIEDVTENAVGVATNLASINSAVNAFNKPSTASKPSPPHYVPVDMGLQSKKSGDALLPILAIGGLLFLALRKE